MRECTSFVLWHCCLSLRNGSADHDSSSVVMKFHLMLLFSDSVLYHKIFNTLRTELLNCLNARSRGLNFRQRASCIKEQVFRYSPENAFYIFNQQIYFII